MQTTNGAVGTHCNQSIYTSSAEVGVTARHQHNWGTWSIQIDIAAIWLDLIVESTKVAVSFSPHFR
jgi:hypothetical protein